MPHVGGGSSGGGGGFHSGSSGTSNIPKTDFYGNAHSSHYFRPGYYYGGVYVPYSRVHRGFHAISRYFFMLIPAILFIVIGILSVTITKSDDRLVEYSLDRYSQVYTHDSHYEKNVLIEIVAYENLKDIDYMPIVGDDVNKKIDEAFGNDKTIFGGYFAEELDKCDNKVESLYPILATSLEKTNNDILLKFAFSSYHETNNDASKTINNTSYNLGNADKLNEEINKFYKITGYNIIIDVNTYKAAYKADYTLLICLVCFGSFLFIVFVFSIVKGLRAVKFINKEDEKGNLKQYFEGEVDYETHVKRYSMDEPQKFDRTEYEKFKKECEQKDDFKKI